MLTTDKQKLQSSWIPTGTAMTESVKILLTVCDSLEINGSKADHRKQSLPFYFC